MKNVTCKQFGKVKYRVFQIDQDSGYIPDSKMVLYTAALPHEMLNVFHAHLCDTQDMTTVSVEYMQDDATKADFLHFPKDAQG